MDPKTRLTSIKTFGLVAFAALMAIGFLGAASAIAETTALCKSDESTCGTGNGTTSLHETSVGKAKLLTSIGTIECSVLFASTSIGASGNPQKIEGNFTYTECKLGGSSCTATEENGPAEIKVLREGHEKAKVTAEYLVHPKCSGSIDCSYTGIGLVGTFKGPLLATQTNGEVTISEQSTTKEAGGFLCPKTNKLDITTTPLTATYLSNGGGGGLSSTSTSLSTSLKGGGKEGAEVSVAEGSKVKDTATLSGENASKAGGTIVYKVYKDKGCKELATEAGKGKVEEGKVPDSEEKELEAGKEYFWLVEYAGDEMNKASTSACSKEVLKVKAKVSISTELSGGGEKGAQISVAEGSKVKDTATLSGTNVSSATEAVDYSVYKDKECKELATKAGEGKVEGSKAASSEEEELEAGAIYYWQAEYLGDSLHEESTSSCSKEVETVKFKTSISTMLWAEETEETEEESEEPIKGEEITVAEGWIAKDTATLSGTSSSTATGAIEYAAYKDKECKELATKAGEGKVEEGKVESSEGEQLEAGVYYWLATYEGDALHEESTSACGNEVLTVNQTTKLCKVEPEELAQLRCPDPPNQGYAGEIIGGIPVGSSPASLYDPTMEAQKVDCSEVKFVGDFKEDGLSAGGLSGVREFEMKNPMGPCTSTIPIQNPPLPPNNPTAKVTMVHLPYNRSHISYGTLEGPQGHLEFVGQSNVLKVRLKLELFEAEGMVTTCEYKRRMLYGVMVGQQNPSGGIFVVTGAWERDVGNNFCPARLALSFVMAIKQPPSTPMGVPQPVWVAGE